MQATGMAKTSSQPNWRAIDKIQFGCEMPAKGSAIAFTVRRRFYRSLPRVNGPLPENLKTRTLRLHLYSVSSRKNIGLGHKRAASVYARELLRIS